MVSDNQKDMGFIYLYQKSNSSPLSVIWAISVFFKSLTNMSPFHSLQSIVNTTTEDVANLDPFLGAYRTKPHLNCILCHTLIFACNF